MTGRLQGGNDEKMPWQSYALIEKTPLTPRIQKFVFAAEDDESIDEAEFHFGPFPHVRVKFGPESKFTRAYSVVSGDMKRFELGVARDDNSRGGSVYLHDNLVVGDTLKAAKGHTSGKKWETDQLHASKHIFILGGIGVTAFLGEIRTLAKQCAQFEIHYAVRSLSDAVYLDQLPKPQTNLYAKSEGKRLRVGDIVPSLDDNGNLPPVIYCCGPAAMIEEARNLTRKLGYPQSQLHFEEFGGGAAGTGDPFEVEIKSTGKVLQVPAQKSLLQILNEAGFDIDSSCEAGNCGACTVDYCKGEVLHHGVALDDEQKQTSLLSCVSRGKGMITVDC
ncbi:2Fe-2S ferredoxin-type domain-containing protein [Nemania abortiva]|nr:2Fe-2S ferredoxin-type domain-containing protein [Nemania abortiva]